MSVIEALVFLVGTFLGLGLGALLFAGRDKVMGENDHYSIFKDCSSALLRMYVDGIMSASEYTQIRGKLTKFWIDNDGEAGDECNSETDMVKLTLQSILAEMDSVESRGYNTHFRAGMIAGLREGQRIVINHLEGLEVSDNDGKRTNKKNNGHS